MTAIEQDGLAVIVLQEAPFRVALHPLTAIHQAVALYREALYAFHTNSQVNLTMLGIRQSISPAAAKQLSAALFVAGFEADMAAEDRWELAAPTTDAADPCVKVRIAE